MMTAKEGATKTMELFTKFDKDGNGTLSCEELERILVGLNPNFTHQEILKATRSIDRNHNGNIDYQEFIKWTQAPSIKQLMPVLEATASRIFKDDQAVESDLPLGQGIGTCYNGSIYLWDLRSGRLLEEFGTLTDRTKHVLQHCDDVGELDKNPHLAAVTCIAVDWKRQLFVTGSSDNTLKLWDFWGKVLKTYHAHLSEVLCVDVDWEGGRMVSGGLASMVKVWEIHRGMPVDTLNCDSGGVFCVSVDWQQDKLVCGAGKTLHVWDISVKTIVTEDKVFKPQCLHSLVGHTSQVNGVLVDWLNGIAFSGSLDKTLCHWNLSTGELLQTFSEDLGEVWCMSGDLSRRSFVTGDSNGKLKVWDSTTRTCVKTLSGHTDCVISLSRVREGFMLSGGRDGTARVWDLETGSCLRSIEAPDTLFGGRWVTTIRAEPKE